MNVNYPDGQSVDFYGFEVVEFYLKRYLMYFSDYSINIRLLYGLIIVCIITMIILFVMFIHQIRRTRRKKKALEKARKNLHEGFYQILISDEKPKVEDLEKACDMTLDEIKKYKPAVLSQLISEICMDLSRELENIPNTETLCSMTGVKALYERNLATKTYVLLTLQNLANMHIPVSEGLLAVYINHHNADIRHMARICHVVSSSADPYRYLEEDLNEHQGLWRFMMLHRLFGWLKANERQMPQFLVLSQKVQNQDSVSFLIKEVAYWGSDTEKSQLHTLFLSPNYRYREAALHAVAVLRDKNQEQAAIDTFEKQPDTLKQEVLRAVYAVNSGQHTEFFVKAFRTSALKTTREVALSCLYSYGTDGRRRFELLRSELLQDENDRVLMDQIDAVSILNQLRTF